MPASARHAPSARRRNLLELCLLRTVLLVLLLLTALVMAGRGWQGSLPFGLGLVLAGLLLVNLLTMLRLRAQTVVSDDELFLQLLFDVLLLTALFLQSGGSGNPFVTYYLVPLAIAASTLGWLQTGALAVFMLLGYSSLFVLSSGSGLPGGVQWPWHSYAGHIAGMWVNFLISGALLVIFVGRMQRRLREQDLALAEQQRRQLQREQAVAMGTLAATAVHELATPLSTLTLVGGELAETLPADSPQREAVALLQSQLLRCRQILADLREQARQPETMPRRSLRDHAAGWLQPLTVWQAERDFVLALGPGADQVFAMPWLLQQVLHNLLQNAAEASRSRVVLTAAVSDGALRCVIRDDGEGWAPELLGRIGQPSVSSKPEGMGLGVFLARVTVAELGGSLDLDNAADGGAEVHLRVPLAALAQGNADVAGGRDASVAG